MVHDMCFPVNATLEARSNIYQLITQTNKSRNQITTLRYTSAKLPIPTSGTTTQVASWVDLAGHNSSLDLTHSRLSMQTQLVILNVT
jgi:hypothetical protein